MIRTRSASEPILLVDDEQEVLAAQRELLEIEGFANLSEASSASRAREVMKKADISLVVLDLKLPKESGLELLAWMRERYPDTEVLVVTGSSDISVAVECMRTGAYDFLVKGSDTARLPAAVRNALDHRLTTLENARLRRALLLGTLSRPESFADFVTDNSTIRHIFVYLEAVAETSDPILITGETGVGKEVVARAVHRASGRTRPFVAVNLGGLDDQSISDTLFGHSRGAFTGAVERRDGLIRRAADGTLFLDEFAEISPESQVKLLRLIDTGEFMPLGSDKVYTSQARLIFATNRKIESETEAGRFRRDLFFRISNHWVEIPPLRSRVGDIRPLLDHLAGRHAERLGRAPLPVTDDVVERITALPLTGNVRELERIVVGSLIRGEWHLDGTPAPVGRRGVGDAAESPVTVDTSDDGGDADEVIFGATLPTPDILVEALLREAVRRHPGNRAAAAAAVGLSPQAFANRWRRMAGKLSHETGRIP